VEIRAGAGSSYRLAYPLNGFRSYLIAVCAVLASVYYGYLPADFGYTQFLPLLSACVVVSFVLSIYCYAYSFYYSEERVADGGNSGCVYTDYFYSDSIRYVAVLFLSLSFSLSIYLSCTHTHTHMYAAA
jgi:hypothetical protein